jgi:hypothetical protein
MKFDLSTAHSTAANVPNNQKPTAQSQKKSWWCHFFRWEKSSPKHLFQYQISGIELMTSRANSQCSLYYVWYTKQKGKDYCRDTQQLPVGFLRFSLSPPISFSSSLFRLLLFYKPHTHTSTTYQLSERERETSGTTGRIDPRAEHCTCVYTSRVPGVLFSADFVNLMREKTANREQEQEESLRCCVCQKANLILSHLIPTTSFYIHPTQMWISFHYWMTADGRQPSPSATGRTKRKDKKQVVVPAW